MKTPASEAEPETTFVPVLVMEGVPVLTDEEREELLASLAEAEADMAAGRTTTFESETFKAWFSGICGGEIDK
jgi:hypothetical protein